jgi:hypothetical protein
VLHSNLNWTHQNNTSKNERNSSILTVYLFLIPWNVTATVSNLEGESSKLISPQSTNYVDWISSVECNIISSSQKNSEEETRIPVNDLCILELNHPEALYFFLFCCFFRTKWSFVCFSLWDFLKLSSIYTLWFPQNSFSIGKISLCKSFLAHLNLNIIHTFN